MISLTPIFLVFIVTTLIEIYVLISVGSVIGGFTTILLIILTAFIGSFLLKQQRISTLKNAQRNIIKGNAPTYEILEGVIIVISGVLLLTPGFVTDTIGLLGLIPFTRRGFINYLMTKNISKFTANNHSRSHTFTRHHDANKDKEDITEVEYWKN